MDNQAGNTQPTTILRKMPISSYATKNNMVYLVAAIIVVIGGVFSGWKFSGGALGSTSNAVVPGSKVEETEAGITDESIFKDTAEGTLQKGGIDGDGTHTLIRGNDKTKHVALSSTVIDLDSFVGKKVQVWGQTLTAEEAFWLMDVGKLKVIQ